MGRVDQLARRWRIVQTLVSSNPGKTVAELVKVENCHPRTVHRDLEASPRAADVPAYQERRDGGSLCSPLGQAESYDESRTLLTSFVKVGTYDEGVQA